MGRWIARGSMNNCWGLLKQWSFQFKINVNRERNATFKPNIRVLVKSHQAHPSHWWCAALTVMFYVMLTSIVLSICSDCVLFYHAVQVKSTEICFDTYFPYISNCWARPRGLQKIVYFNWGQRAEKFENHWCSEISLHATKPCSCMHCECLLRQIIISEWEIPLPEWQNFKEIHDTSIAAFHCFFQNHCSLTL